MLGTFKHRLMAVSAVALVGALAMPSAAMALSGTLTLGGSSTVTPVAQLLRTAFVKRNPAVKITISESNSGQGRADAASGRVMVGMSSSDLTAADKAKGLVGTALGRDALTVIVNPRNVKRNLTFAQIQAIFAGRITNWKQVGGANAPIVVYGRVPGSGTYDFFKAQFMGKIPFGRNVKQLGTNGLVRNAVKANANAIGYVSMVYVNSTVRGLSVSGVAPTRANAISGRYRFVRKLWWCTKGAPKVGSLAKAFIDFSLTPTGQALIATEYLKIK
jgi:phosphate transport system substrate-binding protein